MNELIAPFSQLRPLQGGNLARVANLKEVDHKLSYALMYVFTFVHQEHD